MSDNYAKDVAKVLQGTHNIRVLKIPPTEYDMLDRVLGTIGVYDDAEPGSVLSRRRVRFDTTFSVEMELFNPYNDDDCPTLHFDLLFDDAEEGVEDVVTDRVSFQKCVPESVEFTRQEDGGKLLTIRVIRAE